MSDAPMPDNVGDSDRWQDPRDISGGATDLENAAPQEPQQKVSGEQESLTTEECPARPAPEPAVAAPTPEGPAIAQLPPVGAYLCEPTAKFASYWLKHAKEARDAERHGDALMYAEQAVNGWKNLAYSLARSAHYYHLQQTGRELSDALDRCANAELVRDAHKAELAAHEPDAEVISVAAPTDEEIYTACRQHSGRIVTVGEVATFAAGFRAGAARSAIAATPWDQCEFEVIAWEIDQGKIGISVKHGSGYSAWVVEPHENVAQLLRDGLRYRWLRHDSKNLELEQRKGQIVEVYQGAGMDEQIDKAMMAATDGSFASEGGTGE